jgi:G3E family GTPase
MQQDKEPNPPCLARRTESLELRLWYACPITAITVRRVNPTDPRIPVTVITGFLGAGKTTLIRRLVASPHFAHTALLINEFGEIGIDHHLVDSVDEGVVLLGSGCLCCNINGDLHRALWNLFRKVQSREVARLDRIVIETSGLADPAPLIQSLLSDPLLSQRFRCNGVITLVDALQDDEALDRFEEWIRQVSLADRILLTKTDIASEDQIRKVRDRVTLLNPFAGIDTALDAVADPERLLNPGGFDPGRKPDSVRSWLGLERPASRVGPTLLFTPEFAPEAAPEPPRHTAGVDAFSLTFAEPFVWGELSQTLDTLLSTSGDRILRIKGLAAIRGLSGPRVLHCVRHLRYPAESLSTWPDGDTRSRLVFITRGYPRQYVAQAFGIFCGQEPCESV